MKLKYLSKLLFPVMIAVLMSGCGTQRIKLGYTAMPGTKSPLGTIKPMTMALHVEDQRDPAERDRQGNIINGYGMTIGHAVSDRDVTLVLFDAIRSEFENNGHKVVSADAKNADAKMDVALERLWSETKMHMMDIELIGTLNSEVTIRNLHGSAEPFNKLINSTARKSGGMVTAGAGPHRTILNEVLKEYIKNLTYDPAVLKALEMPQQQSP